MNSDLGFCQLMIVSADHSSGCNFPGPDFGVAGEAVGFVIKVHGFSVYHAGDTNVFSDMAVIDELYAPTHAVIPIGGNFTMDSNEAAYAVAKYLRKAKAVMPMHFSTFPFLPGTLAGFEEGLKKWSAKYERGAVQVVDPH